MAGAPSKPGTPLERSIDRARAAMNLALILTLLILWATANPGIDLLERGASVYHLSESIPEGLRTPPLRRFIEEVDASEGELIAKISRLDVGLMLEIRGDPLHVVPESSREHRLWQLDSLRADTVAVRLHKGPLRDVFQTMQTSRQISAFLVQLRIEEINQLLAELEVLVRDAGVGPETTFAALQDRFVGRIKVPFIDQEIDAHTSIFLMGVGLVAILGYLVSVCGGILLVAARSSGQEGADWLFFHPGILSVLIGGLWLLSPALSIGAAGWVGLLTWKDTALLILPLLVLGVAAIRKAREARVCFLSRLMETQS